MQIIPCIFTSLHFQRPSQKVLRRTIIFVLTTAWKRRVFLHVFWGLNPGLPAKYATKQRRYRPTKWRIRLNLLPMLFDWMKAKREQNEQTITTARTTCHSSHEQSPDLLAVTPTNNHLPTAPTAADEIRLMYGTRTWRSTHVFVWHQSRRIFLEKYFLSAPKHRMLWLCQDQVF